MLHVCSLIRALLTLAESYFCATSSNETRLEGEACACEGAVPHGCCSCQKGLQGASMADCHKEATEQLAPKAPQRAMEPTQSLSACFESLSQSRLFYHTEQISGAGHAGPLSASAVCSCSTALTPYKQPDSIALIARCAQAAGCNMTHKHHQTWQ